MVQPELRAQDGYQVWHDLGRIEQVDVRLTPVQQIDEPVGGGVGWRFFGDLLIENFVQRVDRIGINRVGDGDVALEVKQVAVVVIHAFLQIPGSSRDLRP